MKVDSFIKQIVRANPASHKGQNGRVLVIGGSKLFHAASFWAAAMAAKIVDMVHFSSPTMENNELMRVRAKEKFWDGIVVSFEDVEHYIEEDDAILIGPGMERGEETRKIVNKLLTKYPEKRWVVDGGALQEVDPNLLTGSMVVTPNFRELTVISGENLKSENLNTNQNLNSKTHIQNISKKLGVTVLAKGKIDLISDGKQVVVIEGGNAGMTKGGTGDVLAGVVTALYAKSPPFASCVVASYINKRAGEKLEKKVGNFYGAAELIPEVQIQLAKVIIGQ